MKQGLNCSRKAQHQLSKAHTARASQINKSPTKFETPIHTLLAHAHIAESRSRGIIGCRGDCDHRQRMQISACAASRSAARDSQMFVNVSILRLWVRCRRIEKQAEGRAVLWQVRARCAGWLERPILEDRGSYNWQTGERSHQTAAKCGEDDDTEDKMEQRGVRRKFRARGHSEEAGSSDARCLAPAERHF